MGYRINYKKDGSYDYKIRIEAIYDKENNLLLYDDGIIMDITDGAEIV
jgi:hypothetical protein